MSSEGAVVRRGPKRKVTRGNREERDERNDPGKWGYTARETEEIVGVQTRVKISTWCRLGEPVRRLASEQQGRTLCTAIRPFADFESLLCCRQGVKLCRECLI